jgi:UDPglucose 6-dehydrogenase
MKISIIGTITDRPNEGYVGLVSGDCFADVGNAVLCLDADERKIGMLDAGRTPTSEPGLDALVAHKPDMHDMREAPSLAPVTQS